MKKRDYPMKATPIERCCQPGGPEFESCLRRQTFDDFEMAWGGAAYDPASHTLIIPVNNLAAEVRLIPRDDFVNQVRAGREIGGDWEFAPQNGTPYGMARRFLLSPLGLPCTPPFGTLNAVNADTGELRWSVPLGQFPSIRGSSIGPPAWGSFTLGGPIVLWAQV